MVNYQNGKIYKIEDVGCNECYIGSTTKQYLSYRMSEHRCSYSKWTINKKQKNTVYEIFDKYGVENCRIVLVELFPCETKDELSKREAHFIKTSQCVNKYIPCRTEKEYRMDNRISINKKKLDYYYANLENMKMQMKEYRITNKATIRVKKAEVIECACGFTYARQSKLRHMKTEKHLNALANQTLTI